MGYVQHMRGRVLKRLQSDGTPAGFGSPLEAGYEALRRKAARTAGSTRDRETADLLARSNRRGILGWSAVSGPTRMRMSKIRDAMAAKPKPEAVERGMQRRGRTDSRDNDSNRADELAEEMDTFAGELEETHGPNGDAEFGDDAMQPQTIYRVADRVRSLSATLAEVEEIDSAFGTNFASTYELIHGFDDVDDDGGWGSLPDAGHQHDGGWGSLPGGGRRSMERRTSGWPSLVEELASFIADQSRGDEADAEFDGGEFSGGQSPLPLMQEALEYLEANKPNDALETLELVNWKNAKWRNFLTKVAAAVDEDAADGYDPENQPRVTRSSTDPLKNAHDALYEFVYANGDGAWDDLEIALEGDSIAATVKQVKHDLNKIEGGEPVPGMSSQNENDWFYEEFVSLMKAYLQAAREVGPSHVRDRSTGRLERRGSQLSPMEMVNKLRELSHALKQVHGVDEMAHEMVDNFAEEISADPVPASEEYGMDWVQFNRFAAKPLANVDDVDVKELLAEIRASVSGFKSARDLQTRKGISDGDWAVSVGIDAGDSDLDTAEADLSDHAENFNTFSGITQMTEEGDGGEAIEFEVTFDDEDDASDFANDLLAGGMAGHEVLYANVEPQAGEYEERGLRARAKRKEPEYYPKYPKGHKRPSRPSGKDPLAALISALADIGEDQIIADFDLDGKNPDVEGAYNTFRGRAGDLGDGPEVEDAFNAFRAALAKRSARGLRTRGPGFDPDAPTPADGLIAVDGLLNALEGAPNSELSRLADALVEAYEAQDLHACYKVAHDMLGLGSLTERIRREAALVINTIRSIPDGSPHSRSARGLKRRTPDYVDQEMFGNSVSSTAGVLMNWVSHGQLGGNREQSEGCYRAANALDEIAGVLAMDEWASEKALVAALEEAKTAGLGYADELIDDLIRRAKYITWGGMQDPRGTGFGTASARGLRKQRAYPPSRKDESVFDLTSQLIKALKATNDEEALSVAENLQWGVDESDADDIMGSIMGNGPDEPWMGLTPEIAALVDKVLAAGEDADRAPIREADERDEIDTEERSRSARGLITRSVPASTALSRLHDRVTVFVTSLDAGALSDLVVDEAEDLASVIDAFTSGSFTPAEAAIALQGLADRFDDLGEDDAFKANDRSALGEFGSTIRRIASTVKDSPAGTDGRSDFADVTVEESVGPLVQRGDDAEYERQEDALFQDFERAYGKAYLTAWQAMPRNVQVAFQQVFEDAYDDVHDGDTLMELYHRAETWDPPEQPDVRVETALYDFFNRVQAAGRPLMTFYTDGPTTREPEYERPEERSSKDRLIDLMNPTRKAARRLVAREFADENTSEPADPKDDGVDLATAVDILARAEKGSTNESGDQIHDLVERASLLAKDETPAKDDVDALADDVETVAETIRSIEPDVAAMLDDAADVLRDADPSEQTDEGRYAPPSDKVDSDWNDAAEQPAPNPV